MAKERGYMEKIRELLLQEERRLEGICQKAIEQLNDTPPGTLRLSKSNESIQYYRCMPKEKKNGRYIPKENGELIHQLAQKSYAEKILRLAERRLSQIQRITRDYEDDEIEQIFLHEHKERQKLIEPVEPIWEQQLEQWIGQEYKGKEFQEGTPLILTENGERVRSKSEKILADYFYRNKIPYKYECPLYLKHFGTVYPDFTFFPKKLRKELYWEHNGKMDDPVYAQNAVRKIQAYEENNLYPGERLILTFETEKMVLNTQKVEKLVYKYLC